MTLRRGRAFTALVVAIAVVLGVGTAPVRAQDSSYPYNTVIQGLQEFWINVGREQVALLLSSTNTMASNTTGAAMSCPVFAGEGTLLGEDSCVWAQASGQFNSQFSTASTGVGWRGGGQKEVADGWFLGGAVGAGTFNTQSGGQAFGQGQNFDASVALKRTMGPWLLAAALGFNTTSLHLQRPSGAPGASPTVQSDMNVYRGGLRLRGAYDFAFDRWYLRPRLDVEVLHTVMPGFQEYGQGPFTMAVSGRSTFNAGIVPVLELGGRFDVAEATVLRPYAAVGAIFLPDNTTTIDASFIGPLAQFGSFRTVYAGPSVLGTVEAGLQLYRVKGLEMKAEYKLAAGDNYLSQSVGLRGAWHF
jgi:hypothetical protein